MARGLSQALGRDFCHFIAVKVRQRPAMHFCCAAKQGRREEKRFVLIDFGFTSGTLFKALITPLVLRRAGSDAGFEFPIHRCQCGDTVAARHGFIDCTENQLKALGARESLCVGKDNGRARFMGEFSA